MKTLFSATIAVKENTAWQLYARDTNQFSTRRGRGYGFELGSDFSPHLSGHEPVFSQAIAHLPSEKFHATAGDDRDRNHPYRLAHRLCHCAAFQPRLQQYRWGLTPQIPPAKTTRLPVLRSLSQIASSLELPFKFFKSPLQHR